jgi:UvrD-like helicase C-terminal domain/AAA domain
VGTDQEKARIVRFWQVAEMFSPPPVHRVDQKRVFAAEPGQPLPWEPAHSLARVSIAPDRTWQHVVYLGVYQLDAVFAALSKVFPPDPNSYEERPDGESALAAVVVSPDGMLLAGSQVLSSCAWSTGEVLRSGPAALTRLGGFDRAAADFEAALAELVGPEPGGDPVGHDLLRECVAAAAAATCAGLATSVVRVESHLISRRRQDDADRPDFLNSFIVDDLGLVADQLRAGRAGGALRDYLRPDQDVDSARRVDVRSQLSPVFEAVAPGHVPLGRWPGAADQPAALSQQLAVNSALRMPAAGVLAVNGPPGTGKTTMLRDLIAGVVVERARALAALAHPSDAFVRKLNWPAGDRTRVAHEWAPGLTGFELVVASANNGAVENVTNEIPARDAIDDSWRDAAGWADYFPDIASTLLSPGREVDEGAGWALTAARLGNRKNRSQFVTDFWYGRRDKADPSQQRPGMLAVLKEYEQIPPDQSWPDAVAAFERVVDAAEEARAARDRAYRAVQQQARLRSEQAAALVAQSDAATRLAGLRADLAAAEATAEQREENRAQRVQARVDHRQFRPGFLEWLTSLGRTMRAWQRLDQELAAAVTAADEARDAARTAAAQVAATVQNAAGEVDRLAGEISRRETELLALDAELDQARATFGDRLPDDTWWRDRKHRELAAPWIDAAWNAARSNLFLAALRLHKAFIRHVPTQLRQSLHGAADIIGGQAPRDLVEPAARAAWHALFFVVPVVSTSFASFARVFSHLSAESLGWLLVDEAGQSSPQQVTGALWRSRRAVVVGDPLQLEPITTLPFRAEQAIRAEFGVDEQWLPSRSSVQARADRLASFGTWLPGADGQIWVGAPLTVHRRCDQPMFGVVNDMTYDGLMINGTSARRALAFTERYPALPPTGWFDLAAADADGHWRPAEGDQLDQLLATLAALDFPMTEVMVVSPFRDVARQLDIRGGRCRGLVAGTVHRAQGKQADVVILVLGGDPVRPGAKAWAAQRPNLLNVAVSRAKHRLYVIGDRQAWQPHRHFDILAARLPRA